MLLGEAWRDIVGGVAGVVLFGLLLAATLLGAVGMDLATVGALVDRAQQFQAAGASVMTIQSPGHIDGAACESLNQVAGVRAAGALRPAVGDLTLDKLPQAGIAGFEVTASLPSVLRSEGAEPGVHMSSAVGESLGVGVGRSVSFRGLVPGLVAGLFPWEETDGRRGGLGYSVLIPVDADAPFDECWADVWPVSPNTRELLLLTAMPAAGQEPPTLGQLNTTLGTGFDGAASFSQRPTRWLPLVVAGVAFGLGFVATWWRRLEIASDLHAGVTRADVSLKHLVETAACGLVGAALPVAAVVVMAAGLPPSDRVVAAGVAGSDVAAGIGAMLAGTLVVLALIRERHFAQYFRTR